MKKYTDTFKNYNQLLSTYLLKEKRSVILLFVLVIVHIVIQLYIPQMTAKFIDSATTKSPLDTLILIGISFIILSVLGQALRVLIETIGVNIGWLCTNQLRSDIVLKCSKMDMSFHNEKSAGEMIERVDGDIERLLNFFSQFSILLLTHTLLLIGILIILFLENVIIGLSTCAFVIISFYVIQKFRKKSKPFWKKYLEINSNFFGFLGESIEGIEDINKNGATNYIVYRFYAFLRKWFHFHRSAWLFQEAVATSTIFLIGAGNTFALAISSIFWFHNEISIGTAYMIVFYIGLLSRPIEEISRQFEDLQVADASISRLRRLQDMNPEITDGKIDIQSSSISLEFKDVSFGYSSKGINLNNINFKLNSGETLGLIGRTGSGKSTLVKLIMRLYDVNQGQITINNIPITDIKIKSLRKEISLVSQEIHIFHGTVRDNLTLFNNKYTDETLINVLEHIELLSWFQSLPNGLDTKISSNFLSSGEAQLFAFARVFLQNPKLIILDETSSKIDRYTEKKIQVAFKKLIENKTAIIIAHRLNILSESNKIMILENGEIKEYGEKVSLLQSNSLFKELLSQSEEDVH
ncbi:ABC transporter ATP-binding protein [Bacillus sp. 166amftsu]|uniref:ABC transporter ATP-binding protein n=1 Tax=Bacillus sp. 166amftsu TaxID=1761753 RepID=UPI000894C894|nr:ABC transporter ATP-binding protein [Bacillus sp. 166amftsu]SDZ40448.1 ATP-binding cassette, subfamily B [Bacillus sp. 166amftsu]